MVPVAVADKLTTIGVVSALSGRARRRIVDATLGSRDPAIWRLEVRTFFYSTGGVSSGSTAISTTPMPNNTTAAISNDQREQDGNRANLE